MGLFLQILWLGLKWFRHIEMQFLTHLYSMAVNSGPLC